ncbi:PaaX family transcriptional regulator C-terminal domain-containing protein [Ornithinimicrobium cavernae]|uniref:PaaX family transcriptional regulator n=1 Tax=Ornithinimicrobium cavernae TaxID=2666047 RepID=UPI0012B1723F|nr:PaaX family transcriptional regulator C-terminal domain-containing protein [Ornithinimicrobium cavernae]
MRARAAVFDLYGDHLGPRGYWAPISGVITLLGSCGIAAPATRTAVSRMTSQGWLQPETRRTIRGYAATPAGRERLGEAWARIYRPDTAGWDGRWQLVVTGRPADRGQRDRVAATLGFLGYGRMAPQTWLAARPAPELAAALDALGIDYSVLTTTDLPDADRVVARTWDLTELAASYRDFAEDTARLRDRVRSSWTPQEAYRVRATLVHRWRKFLFVDPALPAEVLPEGWPGQAARELFLEVADQLLQPARIFVGDALASAGAPAPDPATAEDTQR